MKYFSLRYKLLVITILVLFMWAIAADIPFTFKPGDLISAEQMNENFAVLNASNQELVENFAVLNSGKQELVKGTCVVGLSIRVIAPDGTVTCEVDDIGSGGDAGVDAINGQTGAVTLQAGDNISIDGTNPGQIKISSSSAGSTYSADDTSLALSGTTFSIKDGGVSSSKLADGVVTSGKILPFDATDAYGTFGFSVRNTSTPGAAVAIRGIGGDGIGIGVGGPVGVLGESNTGIGVLGGSLARGIVGLQGSTSCAGTYAVGGCSTTGDGVVGRANSGSGNGVVGSATTGNGVFGSATTGKGVAGTASTGRAIEGIADTGIGVIGISNTRAVIGTQGVISCAGTYAVGGCATTGSSAQFRGGSGGTGTCSYDGSADWSCTSDRNAKENFQPVDVVNILESVAKLPITTWNMKGDANQTPHMGPVAQDFYSTFRLGNNDITINRADAQGVTLAAIQGLYQILQEQQVKIEALRGPDSK